MSVSIDHLVISVNDLQAATETFRTAGFTTNYGGKHADGITENALVILGDGAYLELIALTEGSTLEQATFKALVRPTEGYTGYALITADLTETVHRMSNAGIEVAGIRGGSRHRPDGELLKWRMTRIGEHMSPFMIQDVTSRDLRVPTTPDNIEHPNGVTGVRDIKILVSEFAKMVDAYQAITDIVPQVTEQEAVFMLNNNSITLTKPQDETQRAYVTTFGAVPYAVTFASNDEQTLVLHGARIVLSE